MNRPLLPIALVLASASLPGLVCSQDFAGTAPAAAFDTFALLEHALPPAERAVTVMAASTRWWGLRELETRAVALGGSVRALRVGIGLSQTGAPELGWTTLAVGVGGVTRSGGAALRLVTRHDRDAPWSPALAVDRSAGFDLGAGAWLEPLRHVRVWASAPQVRTRGQPPPLERTLQLGVRAGSETAAWCTLRAPRAGDDGERSLGLVLARAPLEAWAEVRDAPLRGAVGLGVGVGPLRVGVRADSHPVLGETFRATFEWRAFAREES